MSDPNEKRDFLGLNDKTPFRAIAGLLLLCIAMEVAGQGVDEVRMWVILGGSLVIGMVSELGTFVEGAQPKGRYWRTFWVTSVVALVLFVVASARVSL